MIMWQIKYGQIVIYTARKVTDRLVYVYIPWNWNESSEHSFLLYMLNWLPMHILNYLCPLIAVTSSQSYSGVYILLLYTCIRYIYYWGVEWMSDWIKDIINTSMSRFTSFLSLDVDEITTYILAYLNGDSKILAFVPAINTWSSYLEGPTPNNTTLYNDIYI